MKTTCQWLDAVKAALDIQSDYALAKKLDIRTTRIANYRMGRSFIDEDMALRIAEVLRIDAAVVLASAAAERAKRPDVKKAWERIAKTMSAAVFALFFVGFSVFGGSVAKAADGQIFSTANIHYTNIRRRLRRWFFGLAFSSMKGFRLGIVALFVVACGSHNTQQESAIDNTNLGYGYSFDAITPSGLRLRYMPGTPQILPLGTADYRAAMMDSDFADAEDCVQLQGPPPLIIVVIGGTLAPYNGEEISNTDTVIMEDTGTIQGFEWLLRHEFIHALLAANGFPPDRNAAHDSPLFTTCALY